MPTAPARTPARRLADTRALLAEGVDCWVATASAGGEPYLVPLSYAWQDGAVLMATPGRYRTVRNLRARPEVRLAFGSFRDVVIADGVAEIAEVADLTDGDLDRFAGQAGWDPRASEGNVIIRVRLQRVLAWRQENELEGRVLMRDGHWIDEEVAR
ncbi:MAG: pyridoxamine 5'-phosphate oxidase family protein [Actinobacteria bacterium]|nr:pyridoxamine 5'-phosphate oxidase family protein [Actinomycetota bacterium]